MALAPNDLASTAELADELRCTKRNVNVAVRRFGIQRFDGGRVSRSQFLQAKAHLGNATQAKNSAKANRANGESKANGHARADGKQGAEPGHDQPEEIRRSSGSAISPDGKSQAEADRIRSWIRAESEQIELKKKKNLLVERDVAQKVFVSIGRMYRASRELEPAQLAPLLVGKDIAELEEILGREGRAADERLANEVATRFGTIVGADVKPDWA